MVTAKHVRHITDAFYNMTELQQEVNLIEGRILALAHEGNRCAFYAFKTRNRNIQEKVFSLLEYSGYHVMPSRYSKTRGQTMVIRWA